MGVSKQNLSYWKLHSDSTQAKKTVFLVIKKAKLVFNLTDYQVEILANTAGLSLSYHEKHIPVSNFLNHDIKQKEICEAALISSRMFRYYKKITPTKQALLSLGICSDFEISELNIFLNKYGYCISRSCICDIVVTHFLTTNTYHKKGAVLLDEINIVLDKMGVPLLMTRQSF